MQTGHGVCASEVGLRRWWRTVVAIRAWWTIHVVCCRLRQIPSLSIAHSDRRRRPRTNVPPATWRRDNGLGQGEAPRRRMRDDCSVIGSTRPNGCGDGCGAGIGKNDRPPAVTLAPDQRKIGGEEEGIGRCARHGNGAVGVDAAAKSVESSGAATWSNECSEHTPAHRRDGTRVTHTSTPTYISTSAHAAGLDARFTRRRRRRPRPRRSSAPRRCGRRTVGRASR